MKAIGHVWGRTTATHVTVLASMQGALQDLREESLVMLTDTDSRRKWLGIVRRIGWSDLAAERGGLGLVDVLDAGLPRLDSIVLHVEIVGEVTERGLELTYSVPPPRSHAYLLDGSDVVELLRIERGVRLGRHPFTGFDVAMPDEALRYHLAVVGATGCGKSRIAKGIAEDAAQLGWRVLILDHSGMDYADPSRWPFPTEVVRARDIIVPPDVVAELLADLMNLHSEQMRDHVFMAVLDYVQRIVAETQNEQRRSASMLLRGGRVAGGSASMSALLERYIELSREGRIVWSMDRFVESLRALPRLTNARDTTVQKLEAKLCTMVGPNVFEVLSNRRTAPEDVAESLFSGPAPRVVVVDLGSEVFDELKKYIAYSVIREAWHKALHAGGRERVLIVVDEAHEYACRERRCAPANQIIETIAREGRKWGVGLLLATQRIMDLDTGVRGNINTVLFSRLQTTTDRYELAKWVEGVDQLRLLSKLDRRLFYLAGLGNPLRTPILLRTRDVA